MFWIDLLRQATIIETVKVEYQPFEENQVKRSPTHNKSSTLIESLVLGLQTRGIFDFQPFEWKTRHVDQRCCPSEKQQTKTITRILKQQQRHQQQHPLLDVALELLDVARGLGKSRAADVDAHGLDAHIVCWKSERMLPTVGQTERVFRGGELRIGIQAQQRIMLYSLPLNWHKYTHTIFSRFMLTQTHKHVLIPMLWASSNTTTDSFANSRDTW